MKIITNGIEHEHDDEGAHEAAIHGYSRSPHFAVEEKHARNENPTCVITGVDRFTQWHHSIIPFHFARYFGRWELEFSRRNLVFLLQKPGNEFHRVLGHCLFFQSFNPNLMEDIKRFKRSSIGRIMEDPEFKKTCNNRPKSLRDMSKEEIEVLRKYVNKVLPIDEKELELYHKYIPADLGLGSFF
jgi:hypothetical protein